MKLQRGFELHFTHVHRLQATGLAAGHAGSGHDGRRLVAPVPVYRGQDVVGQRVEVNASQVGLRQGVAATVLLQDPQEDVADPSRVWDALPCR